MNTWLYKTFSFVLVFIGAPLLACSVVGCFAVVANKMIVERQSMIIYDINHDALALSIRERVWIGGGLRDEGYLGVFEPNDSKLPPCFWILKPSRIYIKKEKVDLEFGGTLLHYGISIFPEGEVGSGVLKLGDGIWFYSENGEYPKSKR